VVRVLPEGSPPHSRWISPALTALVVVAAFSPALPGGFQQWDDVVLLVDNPAYRGLGWSNLKWMFTTNLMGHYMPLTWITYGLDYILWGLDPFGYHLTSLALHAANTTLVYVVALRLFRAVWGRVLGDGADSLRIGAALTALLFGVHPLRVESVVWITERLDLVCGFFYLLAILMYLRGVEAESTDVRQSRRYYWAAVGMFVLALLSKSMAVTLPVVLLVLDVYPLRRLRPGTHGWLTPGPWRIWQEKLPFLFVGAVVSAVAFRALLGGAAVLLAHGARAVRAATDEAPVIDPEVRVAAAQGRARVLVELRLSGASPPPGAAAQERAIAATQQAVLARLSGTSHRVVRQYTSVPLLALEIGADALRALEGMGDLVARVRAERVRPPSTPG